VSTVWEEKLLGDLIVFKNGKRIENTDYDDNGLNPVYGSNGIIGRTNKRNVVGESIIVGRVGAYCGSLQYSNHSAWITDNAIYGVVKPGNDTRFLYYLMNTIPIREFAGGSAQPLINQTILNNISVNVPNLKIQRRIADILGSIDDKIELNRRMNETLEQMAMALYKHWFVDFGPFQDGEFEESEFGTIPKGWKVVNLADIAFVQSGKRPPNVKKEAPFPIYGGGGVMGMTDEPLFSHPVVVTGRVGTLGLFFRVNNQCWPSDNTLVIYPKNHANFNFIYQLLKMINIDSLRRGSTQPLITQGELKNVKVILPAEIALEQYLSKINPLYSQIDANIIEISLLEETRDYILPRLLSGEIEVREAEEQVEEVLANA
jgi:type I restriction enzyme S subunit